jgi:preprotein translocase subunit SecG
VPTSDVDTTGGRAPPSVPVLAARPASLYPVLTAITAALNVAASLLMIVLVLLHSGKGGGLSDMFGGGMGASAMGSTVMERNLDRITVVVALIWGFTVVALSLMLGG